MLHDEGSCFSVCVGRRSQCRQRNVCAQSHTKLSASDEWPCNFLKVLELSWCSQSGGLPLSIGH